MKRALSLAALASITLAPALITGLTFAAWHFHVAWWPNWGYEISWFFVDLLKGFMWACMAFVLWAIATD